MKYQQLWKKLCIFFALQHGIALSDFCTSFLIFLVKFFWKELKKKLSLQYKTLSTVFLP